MTERYEVFARRYRPRRFDDVVGQEAVTRTLQNAIRENRVGHAYLFCGPRGVGKTTLARIFSKALNCVKGPTPDPCGECEVCLAVQDGTDADVVEMDAASNRLVEDARALREGVRYAPLRARTKVYILDEAHMLTPEAFNTLLKTLEEPPPHVKFIFATTDWQRLPETIRSRCQRFDFRRITENDIVRRLAQIVGHEKLKVDDAILHALATYADGSMRDGESLLDQIVCFRPEGIDEAELARLLGRVEESAVARLADHLAAGQVRETLTWTHEVYEQGVDPAALLRQVASYLRTLLVVKACGVDTELAFVPAKLKETVAAQAGRWAEESLLYALQIVVEGARRLRDGVDPRLVLELTLAKIARSGDLVKVEDALKVLAADAPAAPERPRAAAPAPPLKKVAPPPTPAPPPVRPAEPEPEESLSKDVRLDELRSKWRDLVMELKAAKPILAVLNEFRPSALAAGELTLSVPSHMAHLVSPVEKPELARFVDAKVSGAVGESVTIRYRVAAAAAPAAPLYPAPPAASPEVRKVLDLFPGAQVISEP